MDKFACEVLDGQVADDRYRVVDEIIYYRDRIFLIEGSQLKKKILQASHDSPLAGHQGFTKTYRAIREVLMEGPQEGRTPTCSGVRCLPEEQGGDESSRRIIATSSHSKGEMGVYFDGLHHRVAHGTGQGLYFYHR